jgi:hypothetical protein
MTTFGFLLPTREIVMNQDVPDFSQILDLAEHAEALGFAPSGSVTACLPVPGSRP